MALAHSFAADCAADRADERAIASEDLVLTLEEQQGRASIRLP